MHDDELKRQAAEYAVQYVTAGMVVGLGHGSTARFALLRLASLLHLGELQDIKAVPCSTRVEQEARAAGIPLTSFSDAPYIDLTIDGADEVTTAMEMIKGGGGAMLREKIVAEASRRVLIVIDESKLSPVLGTRARVPIEVIPFGWQRQVEFLVEMGGLVELRQTDDDPFYTDNGNLILDCDFGIIRQPETLAEKLQQRAGIVAHGLFLNLASEIIIATTEGIHILPEN